jgi:hypothetical protein
MSREIFFREMESNYSELDQVKRSRLEMWMDSTKITDAELVKLAEVITGEWVNENYTKEFPKLPIIKKYFDRVRTYNGPSDKASQAMSVLHDILARSKKWTAPEIWGYCRKIKEKKYEDLTGEEKLKYTHFLHYWDDLYNIGVNLKEHNWSDDRVATYLETVKISIISGDRVVYPEFDTTASVQEITNDIRETFPSFRNATPVEGML